MYLSVATMIGDVNKVREALEKGADLMLEIPMEELR
jgi:hypothetical protein